MNRQIQRCAFPNAINRPVSYDHAMGHICLMSVADNVGWLCYSKLKSKGSRIYSTTNTSMTTPSWNCQKNRMLFCECPKFCFLLWNFFITSAPVQHRKKRNEFFGNSTEWNYYLSEYRNPVLGRFVVERKSPIRNHGWSVRFYPDTLDFSTY